MNLIERFRQKYEGNKLNCLMKKIRFYKYLISYGNTSKRFVPGVEIKNKTTALFFPTLMPIIGDQYPVQKLTTNNYFKTTDPLNQEAQMAYSFAKEIKTIKSGKREAFRFTKRQKNHNINQLIIQSMTPSIKNQQKTTQTISIQNKSRSDRIRPQRLFQDKKREKKSIFSPKKRTYIGDVCYIKQSKKQISISNSLRKQSICPWQIENVFPY